MLTFSSSFFVNYKEYFFFTFFIFVMLGIKPKVQLLAGRQSTIKLHSPEHKGAVFKAGSTVLLIEACFGKIKKQVCGAQIFFGKMG